MVRAWWIALGVGVVAGAALLALVVLRWTPQVPDGAASEALARTVLTGEIAPDVTEGTDIEEIPRSPSGGECLPRIERPAGYMDVCWEAHRSPYDGDSQKDYYLLRIYSTFGPGASGSPRWAVLKGDLVGAPAGGVVDAWPSGEFEGTCQPTPVRLLADPATEETLCGHINGFPTDTWARVVSWTCVGCLLPDDRDRSLTLYVAVGVTEGTVPEWDVSAEFGS